MLDKQTMEEIKEAIRNLNRLKRQEERLSTFIQYKNTLHLRINDVLDELFSSVNLKKSKEED